MTNAATPGLKPLAAEAPPPARPTPTWALWHHERVRAIVSYSLAGAALVTGIVLLGDTVVRQLHGFEAWIVGLGPWAMVVFVLVYAVLGSVFVPDVLIGMVAGAAFGFSMGLAAVAAGAFAGAVAQYALARHLLKPRIDRLVATRPPLLAIQAAVRQQELKLQLLVRLTPLNRALTSYVLGAAGVGFTRFAAACVALVPSLCLEVYFGYAGRQLAQATARPGLTVALHDALVIGGLAVAIALMILVSRAARRAVDAAAAPLPDQPVDTIA